MEAHTIDSGEFPTGSRPLKATFLWERGVPLRDANIGSLSFECPERSLRWMRYRSTLTQISGDGTLLIHETSWTGWTATTAVALESWVESCTPECATGRIYKDPVQVTLLDRVRGCGSPFFSEAILYYPAARPSARPSKIRALALGISYGVCTGPAARTPAESPQSPDAPLARET